VILAVAWLSALIAAAGIAVLAGVRRMLNARSEALAAVLGRRAGDLATALSQAEIALKDHVSHRTDNLAGATESLAEAVRAILMHQRVITGQKEPAKPPARKRA